MFTAWGIGSRKGYLISSVLACALAGGLPMRPARGEDRPPTHDPFTSPEEPTTAASTQPGGSVAVEDLRIIVESQADVTFGPVGCPVMVAGKDVWSLRTGTMQGPLQGEVQRNSVRALSDDGKYFAAGVKSANQEGTAVGVWSTETGQRVCEVPAVPKRFVDLLLFSRNKYLILGGRSTTDLQVWDIQQNKQIKTIDLKTPRLDRGKVAFSADGESFVAITNDRMTLYRTSSARGVAVMSPPRSMSIALTPPPGPKNADPTPTRVKPTAPPRIGSAASDAVFVYAWVQDIKFSPDGREIAAISTHPMPRLIVWDISGKVVFDEPLILPARAFWEHRVQWLPDKSGWLASGYIVDRNFKRPVFGLSQSFGADRHVAVLDADHLLASSASDPTQLQCVTVPWKRIRQSIALMKDPNAGLLSPAKPVSIKSELGGKPAGGAEATASIVETLRRRLNQDGFTVRDGCDTVFTLRLSEKAGDTLPIYTRQSPFDFRGQDTGRTVAERLGTLVVELTVKGQDVPLWRETLEGSSGRSYTEEINDTTVRESMLQSLAGRLSELPIPYFIPKDDKELALPVVVE